MAENFLTRKIGPLPAWGWAAVGVGGFLLYRWYSSRGSASTAADLTGGAYGGNGSSPGLSGSSSPTGEPPIDNGPGPNQYRPPPGPPGHKPRPKPRPHERNKRPPSGRGGSPGQHRRQRRTGSGGGSGTNAPPPASGRGGSASYYHRQRGR